jgi:hypothetical protein
MDFDSEQPHEPDWDDWERSLGVRNPVEHRKPQNSRLKLGTGWRSFIVAVATT